MGDTPVLIPNTMVKTQAADGTILETVWESRWLPDPFGGIAQLGEHLPCKQGVKGSNPFISTQQTEVCWTENTKYSLRADAKASGLFLENRILKLLIYYIKFAKRYNKTSEGSCKRLRDQTSKTKQNLK